MERVARYCYPLPVVVTPVDVDSVCEITSVSEFEKQYGNLLRSTPHYHGLRLCALKSALAKRSAIHLDAIKWMSDPILVSAKSASQVA